MPDPSTVDWTYGHLALAERMHEVWVLTGRPDPFGHDMEAWQGFALAVMANESVHGGRPDPNQSPVVPANALICACGHLHLVSLGDDGADAGCSLLGLGCNCRDWVDAERGYR